MFVVSNEHETLPELVDAIVVFDPPHVIVVPEIVAALVNTTGPDAMKIQANVAFPALQISIGVPKPVTANVAAVFCVTVVPEIEQTDAAIKALVLYA